MTCICGSTKFFHYGDYGQEYDVCVVCNRAYDEAGREITEEMEEER